MDFALQQFDPYRPILYGTPRIGRSRNLSIPLRYVATIGGYILKQHLARPQALSARADAGAAVPLQSRLRRLRQDRLSRRDPEPAPVRRGRARARSTNAARRSSRSPAASRCCTRTCRQIVEGIIARKKFVYPLHQRAAARKEDRPVQAEPLFHLVDPSRRRPGRCTTSRCARTASTTARSRRSSCAKSKGFRVTINCTLFDDAQRRQGRRLLRLRDGDWASTASPCRPATPTSARRTSSTSSTAQRTKQLFRDIFRARRRRQEVVVQPVRPVPRLPRRQPDLSLHARGATRPATSSAGSGPATCSAKATRRPSRS